MKRGDITGIGANISQCQWINPDEYGQMNKLDPIGDLWYAPMVEHIMAACMYLLISLLLHLIIIIKW